MAKQARATLDTPPTPAQESVREAVACFLAERDLAPSSYRVYAVALGRLSEQLAPNTPLSEVTPRTLAAFMTSSYPTSRGIVEPRGRLLSAVQFRHEMAPSRRSRWGRRDRASRPALARLW